MFWPTPQDYNEAVQLPEGNFGDDDLRQGRPELNSLGLPKPISGSFASVYKIRSRGKDWAVKCFLHNLPDQHERYIHISDFVHNDDLPYTIDFEYLARGVKVRDDWYPVLKMEWLEGEQLVEYVRSNLSRSYKLSLVADRFKEMLGRMRSAQLAHADLQHGNILVVKDELRLVDYDGMYVPQLNGFQSNELGHRNYQHPGRTRVSFGPYLDNFSAWVIYASLRILSRDASVWNAIQPDGESLLFRQADFQSPELSSIFKRLDHHECAIVRNLSRRVHANCYKKVEDVPALEGVDDDPVELPDASIIVLANTGFINAISFNQKEQAAVLVEEPRGLPEWVSPEQPASGLTVSMVNAPVGVQVVDSMLKLVASAQSVAQAPAATVYDSAIQLVSQPAPQLPAAPANQGTAGGATGPSSANGSSAAPDWWNAPATAAAAGVPPPGNAKRSHTTSPAVSPSARRSPTKATPTTPYWAQRQGRPSPLMAEVAVSTLLILGAATAAIRFATLAQTDAFGTPDAAHGWQAAKGDPDSIRSDMRKLHELARQFMTEKRYDKAAEEYKSALDTALDFYGVPNNAEVGDIALGYGQALDECRLYAEAEEAIKTALKAYKQDGDLRGFWKAEHEHGVNRYDVGDYASALSHFTNEIYFWQHEPATADNEQLAKTAQQWATKAEVLARAAESKEPALKGPYESARITAGGAAQGAPAEKFAGGAAHGAPAEKSAGGAAQGAPAEKSATGDAPESGEPAQEAKVPPPKGWSQ